MTQENLAHELGVTFSTVNGWENGRHLPIPPLVRIIVKFASDSGVTVDPAVLRIRRRRGTGP
jgi:transcriptional regulator with XRE-family HTH domain